MRFRLNYFGDQMNNLKKIGAIALILGLALSSCKKKEEDDNTGVLALLYAATATDPTKCETPGVSVSDLGSPSTTAVCTPSAGSAKHFVVEGLEASGHVFYFSVGNLATDTAATVTASSLSATANIARLYLYPSFATPAPIYAVQYSPNNAASGTRYNITGLSNTVTKTAASTICFDVNDAAPSRITLWATGLNGADCSVKTSLTAANSVMNKKDWNSTVKLDSRTAFISFKDGGNSGTAKFTKVTASTVLAVQD